MMNKQDPRIYRSHMDRMAFALFLNQGVILIFGALLGFFRLILSNDGSLSEQNEVLLLTLESIAYILGFMIPSWLFNKMNKNAEKEIYEPIENESMPTKTATVFVAASLGVILLVSYLNYFIVGIFGDYSDFTAEHLWSTSLDSPYEMVIYFISSAIIPAFVEEYFFRFTLCRSMRVWGRGTAIIVSSVAFALMHTNIEQTLYTFVAGVLLAYIYLQTDNIAFPIVIHFLNNAIPTVGEIIGAKWGQEAFDVYTLYSDISIIVISLISAVIFAMHFGKRGRIFDKLVLKRDENGDEVAPLSVRERICGFFSKGMTLFTIYCIIATLGLIYMSERM